MQGKHLSPELKDPWELEIKIIHYVTSQASEAMMKRLDELVSIANESGYNITEESSIKSLFMAIEREYKPSFWKGDKKFFEEEIMPTVMEINTERWKNKPVRR